MSSKLLAPMRTWEARRALRTARRRADEELATTRLPPPRLAWRAVELTSDQSRVALARSLTDAVHAADERLLPTASPLARRAVRECRPELLALAGRLYDLSQPVTARGILWVERLLADGRGPMYGDGDAGRLLEAARRARTALEGNE